jgi:hypothetical protein
MIRQLITDLLSILFLVGFAWVLTLLMLLGAARVD